MVTKTTRPTDKATKVGRPRSASKTKKTVKKQQRKKSKISAATVLRKVDKMVEEKKDSGKLKIGILLTYPRLEVKKEELISHRDQNRPWTKLADPKFVVERKFRREKPVKTRHPLGKYAIPTDVAVGCHIKHHYGEKVEVDMILPHEISQDRLNSNDINFFMIYDLLESFHTDKSKDKKIYNELKKCLETCDNIFPPHNYQKLIFSKIEYYNYFIENNIAIAPTMTLTTEQYAEMGGEATVKKIIETATNEEWGRFICKPVYGQEAIDCKFFETSHKKSLARYLERCMKKYPGIVIQKEIKNFGNSKKCPELRMYYVGNQYQYSVNANENTVIRPRQEGGSLDTPLDSLKSRTRKILRKLPPIVMPNGKRLPRLLTRLDMGYIVDGKYSPFVNEVEFVPSLYAEDCAHHPDRLIDAKMGHQMVKIAKMYKK